MNIPVSEYRRMAREAMRGRFAYLTLIAAMVSLVSLSLFDARRPPAWMIAAMVAVQLLAILLGYGQESIFLRRFRGEPDGPALLFQVSMLPRLTAVFLLRDALPTALLQMSGRMTVFTYAQLSRAATLQLVGLAISVVMLYNYGMAEYMLINTPTMSPLAALRESRRALSGNRVRLFILSLSFFGWMLLVRIPDLLVASMAPKLDNRVYTLLSTLWTAPLLAYIQMSQTAFFEVITGRRTVAIQDAPVFESPVVTGTPRPVMTADETVAWDMLDAHGFSRRRLEADGELEAYLAMNISPEKESRWQHEWLAAVMQRYPTDPDRMDDALQWAAEHADADVLRQALQAMDDALTGGQVIEGMIARQTLSLVRALQDGDFDPDAAHDIRAAARDLADGLQARLQRIDPDGAWRETVREIRELTAAQ